MKRILIGIMVAVILSGIFAENSNAAKAMEENKRASFSYRCDLIREDVRGNSQILMFTFGSGLKKKGWAVVQELKKLGWNEKKLGNFAYSPDFNSPIRDVDMRIVVNNGQKGVLALLVNGIMYLSLQKSDGSSTLPKEIANKVDSLFRG